MKIYNFEAGPFYTNCYIVFDEKDNTAVVIDAPPDCTENVLAIAKEKNLNIKAILLTHSHWDHTADAPLLKEKTGADVYIHKDDEYRLLDPEKHKIVPIPFDLVSLTPDYYFKDGGEIEFSGLKFEIIHTPGHTEGSVCLLSRDNNLLFSGDTLFNMGVGRTDLPGGSEQTLAKSLKTKLMTLPGDYKAYPGHGPSTMIENERRGNSFILHYAQFEI